MASLPLELIDGEYVVGLFEKVELGLKPMTVLQLALHNDRQTTPPGHPCQPKLD